MSRKQLPLHTVGVVEGLRDCHPTRQRPHAGMSATAHYARLAYCSWHQLFKCYDKWDVSMILPARSDEEHVEILRAESVTVPVFCHGPSETFRCVRCQSETRCSLHCRVWDVFERGIWGGEKWSYNCIVAVDFDSMWGLIKRNLGFRVLCSQLAEWDGASPLSGWSPLGSWTGLFDEDSIHFSFESLQSEAACLSTSISNALPHIYKE